MGEVIGDVQAGEQVLATLTLRAPSRRALSTLTVTTARVYGTLDRGVFGKANTSIPIASVDSVFFGWSRNPALLYAGAIALLVGGLMVSFAHNDQQIQGYVALAFGFILSIVFLVYRPTVLLVRSSGGQVVGGRPATSTPTEAEKFTVQLNSLLAQMHVKV